LRALIRSRCSDQLARRVEPDDVVQSVFRRFFRQVMRGVYDVPPGEELWGLLLVIALNRLRSEEAYHRAEKRDVRLCEPADPSTLAAYPAADTALLEVSVVDVLERLPAGQRQLVELRIQGHEVAAIAQIAGRSKRTVERTLQNVRARLRGLLEVD